MKKYKVFNNIAKGEVNKDEFDIDFSSYPENIKEDIEDLNDLKANGFITEEEYNKGISAALNKIDGTAFVTKDRIKKNYSEIVPNFDLNNINNVQPLKAPIYNKVTISRNVQEYIIDSGKNKFNIIEKHTGMDTDADDLYRKLRID